MATDDPNVNVQRVAVRVAAGGHDVPEDRTRSRYTRTLALAPVAIGYADQAFIFDNTHGGETGGGLSQQAGLVGDCLVASSSTTAAWVARLIEQVNERAAELSNWDSPQLAWLHDNCMSGEIVFIGKHFVLQVARIDEENDAGFKMLTLTLVIHDLVLLGSFADRLAVGQVIGLCYHDGVASEQDQIP